ncbi:MAG TPA: hypothetical protein VG755_14935 [Nannocystaceae bacterium]|nr:hypothetical protein [Nannocystaceae bacterium]
MTDGLHEPVRWLDDPDAGTALRSDLAHGATATASGVDYGATLTALRSVIATQTAPLPAAAPVASSTSVGVKVVLGVLVAGGIAAWIARGDVEQHDAAATVARAQLEPATRTNVQVPEPPSVQPAAVPAAKPIAVPSAPEEIELVEPTPDEQPADARGDRKPTKKRVDESKATPAADTPAVSDADRYVREAKLVAQARRALADDPDRALALTRQVEREFPNGLLEEERRALEIRALAGLGRDGEADSAAKGFLAKFPDGPHAAAVRRAIED